MSNPIRPIGGPQAVGGTRPINEVVGAAPAAPGQVRVKICGLQHPEEARAVAEAGADFAGMNFIAGAKRHVSLDRAAAIRAGLGAVTPVGLFMDQPDSTIHATTRALSLTWIQLHGQEPPARCHALAQRYTVIKALTAEQVEAGAARRYARHVHVLLIDGRRPGSGERWDYSRVQGPRLQGAPLWIAGGLAPGTVAAAIRATHAAGVDVATGVAPQGRIDPRALHDFVHTARSAAHSLRT